MNELGSEEGQKFPWEERCGETRKRVADEKPCQDCGGATWRRSKRE
jgi:rRNA maturation endonuclease Nob1